MSTTAIPERDQIVICFAHVAYRMAERFAARNTGIKHFQVNSLEELTVKVADAECPQMLRRHVVMKQLGAAIVKRGSSASSHAACVPPPELPVRPRCFGSTSGRVSR